MAIKTGQNILVTQSGTRRIQGQHVNYCTACGAHWSSKNGKPNKAANDEHAKNCTHRKPTVRRDSI